MTKAARGGDVLYGQAGVCEQVGGTFELFPAKNASQRIAERLGNRTAEVRSIGVKEEGKLRNPSDGPAPVAIPEIKIDRTLVAMPFSAFPR